MTDVSLAPIYGAAVGGFIAAAASIASTYLLQRFSLKKSFLDNFAPRKIKAYEDIFYLLLVKQRTGHLSSEQLEMYIIACMWLPEDLRSDFLEESMQDLDSNTEKRYSEILRLVDSV